MERHLEPLAIAANILQAANCRLDTVLLTFGYLFMRYRTICGPEDMVGHTAILDSLEKRWLAAEQDVFIAAVIVNPLFRTAPFAPNQRFTNARIKTLLASLYSRFFRTQDIPSQFYSEAQDYLMGSGQYHDFEATCARHLSDSKRDVRDSYRF